MIYIVISMLFGAGGLSFWWRRRQRQRLAAENATRERLGLPPLTLDDLRVDVVEKSAEYRGNVNQHM